MRKCNLGKVDRVIRAVVGVAIVGAGVYAQSWLGAIGLVLMGTAAIGWCPLYVPFGLSSCAVENK